MRYTLKEYQVDAVWESLRRLEQARSTYHGFRSLSQFSLAATTGAGKTVMAAAIIEALFFGSDEFDFQADPGAVVLWFSDSPDLNEQSRARIQAAASELDSRLRVIETTFSEPALRPGNVYFLNTQKLSKNSRLVRGERESAPGQDRLFQPRPDEMQSSIYDVIRNTVENKDLTLYFVLDEAHRGMNSGKDRETIVQRLINGGEGTPAMPVVFGISATVQRFTEAMAKATNRTALPPVEVDASLVQASGLLKDDIVLTIPTEEGVFDTTLLRRAVERVRASSAAWAEYAHEQEEADLVSPLLVVQMADKPSPADMSQVLDTIYEVWPELPLDAVAHVFGTHTDLLVGQQSVPYVEPQRVQDTTHVRVLLAMEAISTGWDCPRAEVLVSFRTRNEPTYIHQLLGRMLRTPLARRIPGNEVLNSVDCLLPHFDRKTATVIAQMLMKGKTALDAEGEGDEDDDKARRVLFDPVRLAPNPDVPKEVWAAFEAIPTVTIPKSYVKPIKRLDALAVALSKDGLIEEAVQKADRHLCKVLDGRAVQYDEKVARAREDVLTMTGEEARGRVGGEGFSYTSFEMSADARAIEDSYQAAARLLSHDLASAYVDHLVGPDGDSDELLEANITVAALGRVSEIVTDVEEEADDLARQWLTQTRVARKGLSDERRAEYDRLEGMSTQPERISLTSPKVGQTDRKVREKDGTEKTLPTRQLHLMAANDEDHSYPVDLNEWEKHVLDSESKQPGFKGWYRNPARATNESLAVAYKDNSGVWKALRPDFIFFGSDHNGAVVADLVDPHGHHLADAMPKLRGLADFAEKFSSDFRRIESVAESGGKMRVLDLTKPPVRDAIRAASAALPLYESGLAYDY
ncbi:DEAD/DEAH box helicase family protein [Janibacter terrae]|uniref:DEAD/DEAH box helicase family protein n=1 Tax=Janibacter terrae TaxID=103817 RepID=A0ABZ2FIL2_9MICO